MNAKVLEILNTLAAETAELHHDLRMANGDPKAIERFVTHQQNAVKCAALDIEAVYRGEAA